MLFPSWWKSCSAQFYPCRIPTKSTGCLSSLSLCKQITLRVRTLSHTSYHCNMINTANILDLHDPMIPYSVQITPNIDYRGWRLIWLHTNCSTMASFSHINSVSHALSLMALVQWYQLGLPGCWPPACNTNRMNINLLTFKCCSNRSIWCSIQSNTWMHHCKLYYLNLLALVWLKTSLWHENADSLSLSSFETLSNKKLSYRWQTMRRV